MPGEDILQVASKYIFSGKVSTTSFIDQSAVLNETLNGKRFITPKYTLRIRTPSRSPYTTY